PAQQPAPTPPTTRFAACGISLERCRQLCRRPGRPTATAAELSDAGEIFAGRTFIARCRNVFDRVGRALFNGKIRSGLFSWSAMRAVDPQKQIDDFTGPFGICDDLEVRGNRAPAAAITCNVLRSKHGQHPFIARYNRGTEEK